MPWTARLLLVRRQAIIVESTASVSEHIESVHYLLQDGRRSGIMTPPGVELPVKPLVCPYDGLLWRILRHSEHIVVIPG